MSSKLLNNITKIMLLSIFLLTFYAGSSVVLAQAPEAAACETLQRVTGESCNDQVGENAETVIQDTSDTVLGWLAIAGASIVVIMIVYGGILYAISGGDQNRVATAKKTIIYALVGLLVMVMAGFIINTVIGFADDATDGSSDPPPQFQGPPALFPGNNGTPGNSGT